MKPRHCKNCLLMSLWCQVFLDKPERWHQLSANVICRYTNLHFIMRRQTALSDIDTTRTHQSLCRRALHCGERISINTRLSMASISINFAIGISATIWQVKLIAHADCAMEKLRSVVRLMMFLNGSDGVRECGCRFSAWRKWGDFAWFIVLNVRYFSSRAWNFYPSLRLHASQSLHLIFISWLPARINRWIQWH